MKPPWMRLHPMNVTFSTWLLNTLICFWDLLLCCQMYFLFLYPIKYTLFQTNLVLAVSNLANSLHAHSCVTRSIFYEYIIETIKLNMKLSLINSTTFSTVPISDDITCRGASMIYLTFSRNYIPNHTSHNKR